MIAKAFVRNQAWHDFSSVQRDVNLRIFFVQEPDKFHLQGVVGHRCVAVFGHDEIDADDAGIDGGGLKSEEGLGENLLAREAAKYLIEETDLDLAG